MMILFSEKFLWTKYVRIFSFEYTLFSSRILNFAGVPGPALSIRVAGISPVHEANGQLEGTALEHQNVHVVRAQHRIHERLRVEVVLRVKGILLLRAGAFEKLVFGDVGPPFQVEFAGQNALTERPGQVAVVFQELDVHVHDLQEEALLRDQGERVDDQNFLRGEQQEQVPAVARNDDFLDRVAAQRLVVLHIFA